MRTLADLLTALLSVQNDSVSKRLSVIEKNVEEIKVFLGLPATPGEGATDSQLAPLTEALSKSSEALDSAVKNNQPT